jgi:hypothetical protein
MSYDLFWSTLNLQPRGSLAKPYQVKQVRAVIVRYKMAEETE